MRMLVWSGVVPPLLVLMLIMTNDRHIMADTTNGLGTNLLGWATAAVTLKATVVLVALWMR